MLGPEQLRSFYRRRIAIPVGPDDLVLDVGSGDKPHWRADVLVDRYPDASHGGQRSGRSRALVDRPLFDANASELPFADGAFDYVICSHVLEHVLDPVAVAAEMTRVGRAGYIEVPEAASAKILDFPSHLWWCRLDGSTLIMTAKSGRAFDPEIEAYLDRSGLRRRMERLLDSHFDHRIVALAWRGRIDLRVQGTPDPSLVAAATEAEVQHHVAQSLASAALTRVLALTLRGRRRRAPIRYDDIVLPALRRGTDELLTARVYQAAEDCAPAGPSWS